MSIEIGIKLREQGKAEEALALFMTLLVSEGGNAGLQYQIAWCLDVLEREKEAIPYYEKAIAVGMNDPEMIGAFLGLGSTYRTIGAYQRSLEVFNRAILLYPTHNEFKVFRAMTQYNLGHVEEAMRELLVVIAETSSDENVIAYKRAIAFYSDKLNQIWE